MVRGESSWRQNAGRSDGVSPRPFDHAETVHDDTPRGGLRHALDRAALYAHAGAEVVLESVWPTRCVVCGRPGQVLCSECERALPYVDQWTACPRCGAPWGRRQCTECSSYSLAQAGIERLPFEACVAAVRFDDVTGAIVRAHKDQGERRLADVMGRLVAQAVPPEWACGPAVVAFVPATAAARRRRGFDHGQALGASVARWTGLAAVDALDPPRASDQRGLTRAQRLSNARTAFCAKDEAAVAGRQVVLVDDVMTTGATLCAASVALLGAGAASVRCAVFARV